MNTRKNTGVREAWHYIAIRLLTGLLAWLPERLALGLARWVMAPCWRWMDAASAQRARKQAVERLGLAPKDAAAFVRNHYGHTLAGFAEFARLSRMNADALLERIDEDAFPETVRNAVADGRGVVLVSCHMGNWTWLTSYLGARRLIAGHIYKPFANPRIEARVKAVRQKTGCVLWHRSGAMRLAAKTVCGGGVFSCMMDLDIGSQGWMSPFLGRKASTNALPVELAVRHGAVVIPVALIRLPGSPCRFRLLRGRPLRAGGNLSPAREVQRMLDEVNRELACFIRAHPEQWWWWYPRWKTTKVTPRRSRRSPPRRRS